MPCDNTPGNGALAERVVRDLAELVDSGLAAWLEDSVAVVSTMVDRITPARRRKMSAPCSKPPGSTTAARWSASHFTSGCCRGAFPAGRPRWQDAGATFTGDVTPYEHRKLWLLNGAHSLLAYAGSIRGHRP